MIRMMGVLLIFISGFGLGAFMEFLVPSQRRAVDTSDITPLVLLFIILLAGIVLVNKKHSHD